MALVPNFFFMGRIARPNPTSCFLFEQVLRVLVLAPEECVVLLGAGFCNRRPCCRPEQSQTVVRGGAPEKPLND